tara:strand:+ start:680 stop:904 length:225 start_codon:yes stop_codon:yes gene_type:complete
MKIGDLVNLKRSGDTHNLTVKDLEEFLGIESFCNKTPMLVVDVENIGESSALVTVLCMGVLVDFLQEKLASIMS